MNTSCIYSENHLSSEYTTQCKGARGDLRVKTKVLDKDFPEEEDWVKACRLQEKGQARSLRLGEFLGSEKGISLQSGGEVGALATHSKKEVQAMRKVS